VLTAGVSRDNLEICLHHYKQCQFLRCPGDYEDGNDESNDANVESTNASLWGDTI